MSTLSVKILFLGHNSNSEFGLSNAESGEDIDQFMSCPNKEFKKVFSGNAFNIFTDDTLQKLWVSGCNKNGECGVGHKTTVCTYKSIDYFQNHNIKIKKICVNVAAECIFYISDKHELYACGMMKGLDIGDQKIPKKLSFTDVIDAQATSKCMIVVCAKNINTLDMIIANWCRSYSVPDDIIKLLLSFFRMTTIFSTTNEPGSGHPKHHLLPNKYGWNEVQFFNDKYITKIKASQYHTLFLDETGVVYSCGYHIWNNNREVHVPERVLFTEEKDEEGDIVISDIECGQGHSLALDVKGRVYSWGFNFLGQGGHGGDDYNDIIKPKRIEAVMEYTVDTIKCGFEHSYCKTVCGKHFLWGEDTAGVCTFGDGSYRINVPFRVDEIVRNKYEGKKIVDVVLGFYNTKIIIS